MKPRAWVTSLVVVAMAAAVLPASFPAAVAEDDPAGSAHAQTRGGNAALAVPLMFVENVGQFESQVRFQVRGPQGTVWLTEDGIWYSLLGPEGDSPTRRNEAGTSDEEVGHEDRPYQVVNLKLSFLGANPHPLIVGLDRLETKVSYFTGNNRANWRQDIPVWGGLRYVDLYPGIDLELTTESWDLV